MLRDKIQIIMVPAPAPRRFGRKPGDLERVAEAKSRLTRVTRGLGSA